MHPTFLAELFPPLTSKDAVRYNTSNYRRLLSPLEAAIAMEGLSVAANGLAVVSIAVQLTESFIKLYKFWNSVEDAPQDIAAINEDLQYLISVFQRIQSTKGSVGECVAEGMQHCWSKVLELNTIVAGFDEGFQSSSRKRRRWAAFKVASHSKHIQKFRDSLSETKSTLTLALVHQCAVQAQSYTSTAPIYTTLFLDSQHCLDRPGSKTNLLPERPAAKRAIVSRQQTPPPTYVEQNIFHRNLVREYKTTKAIRKDFEEMISKQPMTTLNLPGLMLHAIEQIAVAKFESNSLEVFAQDGYSVDCNGMLRARTFVYSDNLRYRVSHQATGFRTAFGCLWIRKTRLHLPRKAHNKDEETKCVTSYIFYPNTWIQWLGVRSGFEAIMASAGRNWLYNCKLTVTRAVPDDALIFDLCRDGQTRAVEILLSKGLGSVVDTSPSGWKPLHFAAAGGHVNLCAMLIEAGADKSALAYEGPSSAILSPITLFVASAQDMHAEVKISMLRLFSDCIELTDAKSDGWTVHEWLKRTYALENVPISQNSITWLLRCTATEEYVQLSSNTIWCGLQHAVRTVLSHTRHGRFLDSILNLSHDEYKVAGQERIDAIGVLLAFRVCGRVLLPMVANAGSFCQMPGFDWVHDDLSHREYLQTLPVMYTAWCNMILDYTENLERYLREELEYCQQQLGITKADFLDIDSHHYRSTTCDARHKRHVCTWCADDYTHLPGALASPIRTAVAECIETNHRYGCVCNKADMLIAAARLTELPEYTGTYCFAGNDDDTPDDQFYDAESYLFPNDLLPDQHSVLADVALLLYRSHGRVWLGDYTADEVLCAPCLLHRERYTDKDGSIADFLPRPHHFDGLRLKSIANA